MNEYELRELKEYFKNFQGDRHLEMEVKVDQNFNFTTTFLTKQKKWLLETNGFDSAKAFIYGYITAMTYVKVKLLSQQKTA